MGNHTFCSAACVVKYAGTNKNVPWLNSEAYQMYYEMDFDEKIKGTLSGQDEKNRPEDTGHKEISLPIHTPVEAAPGSEVRPDKTVGEVGKPVVSGAEGREGSSGEQVCLCRSGILTKLRSKYAVAKEQKPRQNCSNPKCVCAIQNNGKTTSPNPRLGT